MERCKARDKAKVAAHNKFRRARDRFGLTLEQYELLLRQSGGVCPICREKFEEKTLGKRQPVLDHCHTTGKVRGFVCRMCNIAIGGLRDDPVIVQRVLEWLA